MIAASKFHYIKEEIIYWLHKEITCGSIGYAHAEIYPQKIHKVVIESTIAAQISKPDVFGPFHKGTLQTKKIQVYNIKTAQIINEIARIDGVKPEDIENHPELFKEMEEFFEGSARSAYRVKTYFYKKGSHIICNNIDGGENPSQLLRQVVFQ